MLQQNWRGRGGGGREGKGEGDDALSAALCGEEA